MEDKKEVVVRFTNNETGGQRRRRKELLRKLFDWKVLCVYTTRFPHDPDEAVKIFDEIVGEDEATIVDVNLPASLLDAVLNRSKFVKRGGRIVRPMFFPEHSAPEPSENYEEILEIKVVTKLLQIQ